MDKFSYAIGLGIGQNLASMGAKNINVDDFAQAIKDVLDNNKTAISHTEARDIVNAYFAELEAKINAENTAKNMQNCLQTQVIGRRLGIIMTLYLQSLKKMNG